MFRIMTEADKDIYFKMSRQFYSSGAALNEITDEKREAFWKIISDGISVKAYIIEYDGKIVGYAITVPYPSQEFGGYVLWIDELFVLPEFRGRGIAKEFFLFAEKLAGKVMLRLEAEPDNVRAIRLYESIGFETLPYIQMIKKSEEY